MLQHCKQTEIKLCACEIYKRQLKFDVRIHFKPASKFGNKYMRVEGSSDYKYLEGRTLTNKKAVQQQAKLCNATMNLNKQLVISC